MSSEGKDKNGLHFNIDYYLTLNNFLDDKGKPDLKHFQDEFNKHSTTDQVAIANEVLESPNPHEQVLDFLKESLVGEGHKELREKLEAAKENSLNNLTQEQIGQIALDKMDKLTFYGVKPEVLGHFTPEQISKIDKSEIANFTEGQFNALSEDQFNALSEEQRKMIDPEVFKKLEGKFLYSEPSFDGDRSERGKSAGNMSPAPAQGQDTAPAPGQVIYKEEIETDDLKRQYLVDTSPKPLGDMSLQDIVNARETLLKGEKGAEHHESIKALDEREKYLQTQEKEFEVGSESKKLKEMSLDDVKTAIIELEKLRGHNAPQDYSDNLAILRKKRAKLMKEAGVEDLYAKVTKPKKASSKNLPGHNDKKVVTQDGAAGSRSRAGSETSLDSDRSHYSNVVDDGGYELVGGTDDDKAPSMNAVIAELHQKQGIKTAQRDTRDSLEDRLKAFGQFFQDYQKTPTHPDIPEKKDAGRKAVDELMELKTTDLEKYSSIIEQGLGDKSDYKNLGALLTQAVLVFGSEKTRIQTANTLVKDSGVEAWSPGASKIKPDEQTLEKYTKAKAAIIAEKAKAHVHGVEKTKSDEDNSKMRRETTKKPQGKQNKRWDRVKNAWGAVKEFRQKVRART